MNGDNLLSLAGDGLINACVSLWGREQFECLCSKFLCCYVHLVRVGLADSKIRLLVGHLERDVHISLAHVNQQSFTGVTQDNDE